MCSLLKTDDFIALLHELELTRNQATKILNGAPIYNETDPVELRSRFQFFLDYSFAANNLKKMLLAFPLLLAYESETIQNKIANLKLYEFTHDDVIRMSAKFASLLGHSEDTINDRLEKLEKYGFEKKGVIRVAVTAPSVLGSNDSLVKRKFKNLEDYGFKSEDIVRMVTASPPILASRIETINDRLSNLKRSLRFQNGYCLELTHEEIKKMAMAYPAILITAILTARRKMRIMSILTDGDKALLIRWAKYWMSSPRRLVGRACVLKAMGRPYKKRLEVFLSNRNFELRYQVHVGKDFQMSTLKDIRRKARKSY